MNVDEIRRMVSGLLNDVKQPELVIEAYKKLKSSDFFVLDRQLKKVWSGVPKCPSKYRLICTCQYDALVDFFAGEGSSIGEDLRQHLSNCRIPTEEFGVLVSAISLHVILSIKPLALPEDLVNPKNLAFLLYDWIYNHSWGARVLVLEQGIELLKKTGTSGEALAKVFAAKSIEGVCCPSLWCIKELASAVLLGDDLVEYNGVIGVRDAEGLITLSSDGGYGPEMVYVAKDPWPEY
ncbi:MAG: hypothetical protein M1324_01820 [Patescibacteria group bacterium]|nr:hypothetical protein [Patescibacteria group bacterium]